MTGDERSGWPAGLRDKGRSSRSILIASVTCIIFAVILSRLIAIRVFAVDFPDLLSVGGVLTAGSLTIVTSLIPKRTRARLLASVRIALESRRGFILSVAALAAAILAAGFSRQEIRWFGPPVIKVVINGTQKTLRSKGLDPGGAQHGAIVRYAFFPVTLGVDAYQSHLRPRPLARQVFNVPLHWTRRSEAPVAAAEQLVLRAFYQFFEQRQVDDATQFVNTIRASRDDAQLQRLHTLLEVVSQVFTGPKSRLTSLAVKQFNVRYPDDPWQPLINAALEFSRTEFAACVNGLSEPVIQAAIDNDEAEIAATERFFRATCTLKQAAAADARAKPRLLARALADYRIAESQISAAPPSQLSSLALPSSIIFQGITLFYSGRFDDSVAVFQRTFSHGEDELRARAHNAAGFARFVQGRLDEAGNLFNAALSISPSFPYARSNYGFVLLAKGELTNARSFFSANAQDLVLQKTSQRDVILANLSLVHVDDLERVSIGNINESYAALAAQLGGNRWDGILDDSTRYAYLARELTDRTYLNGKYYGLEMFAMNFLCRALTRLRADGEGHSAIAVDLDGRIQRIKNLVHPSWLKSHPGGWFSTLANC